MNDKMSISGPVTVASDSSERVALDLTLYVGSQEQRVKKDRKYWLTLYAQCLDVAHGKTLKAVLDAVNEAGELKA
jgi:hypothetical protein